MVSRKDGNLGVGADDRRTKENSTVDLHLEPTPILRAFAADMSPAGKAVAELLNVLEKSGEAESLPLHGEKKPLRKFLRRTTTALHTNPKFQFTPPRGGATRRLKLRGDPHPCDAYASNGDTPLGTQALGRVCPLVFRFSARGATLSGEAESFPLV